MLKSKYLPDLWLFFAVIFLVLFGLVVVSSAGSSGTVVEGNINTVAKVSMQAVWAVLALIVMIVTIYLPTKWFYRYSWLIYIIALVLLALVFVPHIGKEIKGAYRWIDLRVLTFMPSEIMKIAMVLLLSALFAKSKGSINNGKTLIMALLIVFIPAALIYFQPDFGTMLLILGTGAIMIFLAGLPWIVTIIFGLVGSAGLAFIVTKKAYRSDRLTIFLDPWVDPMDKGYQIIRSLYAIASGRLTGLGPGNSMMKYGYLPEAMSDFIFSIIAEEYGVFGVSLLIGSYSLILWRSFRLAAKSRDTFSSFVVLGLSISICLQSIINIGVATASIPATGITLPFVSAGGTSLIISIFSMGIILNISKSVLRDKKE